MMIFFSCSLFSRDQITLRRGPMLRYYGIFHSFLEKVRLTFFFSFA